MWDGLNLRRFPRLPHQCRISIQLERSSAKQTSRTTDISLGGVCVILSKPTIRKRLCKIKLKLSPKHNSIEGIGRIAWSVPTKQKIKGKKVYDVGVEFVKFDPISLNKLTRFLAQK